MSTIKSAVPIESDFSSARQRDRETARIARHAGVIAAGSVAGRVLGLGREVVKSHYFGAGATADALTIAVRLPTLLYDLFIGGMISSSLVPLFVQYDEDGRSRLWEFLNVLLTLSAVVFALCTLLLFLFAGPVSAATSPGSTPEAQALTAGLLRLTAPAALLLGLSGILIGALYALQRFSYPAFAAAMLNGGIVAGAVLLQERLGPQAMAWGLLIGASLQLALQRQGLRDAPLRLRLDLNHPGLRRLAALYAPIFLGLLVEILLSRPLTYRLASLSGTGGIARMEYAQILSQFPRGLVALGVSTAVLPLLAAQAAQEAPDVSAFQATLARGLRLILVLIIPASLSLFILALPAIALLLEHGSFTGADTLVTARALQLYLLALPLAATDGLLVYAFYARQDTLTPALIGVGSVLAYLALAYLLQPLLGLYGIIIADGLKLALHLGLLLLFLARQLGGFGRHGIARTLRRTFLAAAVMSLVTWGCLSALPDPQANRGFISEIQRVLLPALLGLGAYFLCAWFLGIEELRLAGSAVIRRAARIKSHG